MLDLGPIKDRTEKTLEASQLGPFDNRARITEGMAGDISDLIAEVEQLRADVERRRQLHSRLFNQRWTEEGNNDDTK